MSYATCQDMLSRFGEAEMAHLAASPYGEMDTTLIEEALHRASDEADSYLAARYTLPVAPVPPVLAGCVMDMARYHLCGGAAQDTESVMRRYEAAIAWLKAMANGVASLPVIGVSAGGNTGSVAFCAGRRVW